VLVHADLHRRPLRPALTSRYRHVLGAHTLVERSHAPLAQVASPMHAAPSARRVAQRPPTHARPAPHSALIGTPIAAAQVAPITPPPTLAHMPLRHVRPALPSHSSKVAALHRSPALRRTWIAVQRIVVVAAQADPVAHAVVSEHIAPTACGRRHVPASEPDANTHASPVAQGMSSPPPLVTR
jgi:hypothetical protein